MKRENNFPFLFGAEIWQWRRKWIFRERVSNFSLDLPSDPGELRDKVSLRCKGYVWAPFFGSFDKLQKVGVFSYLI